MVFINNDTVVIDNWLRNMIRVLYSHEGVGMVGPVTNFVSGVQQIPVTYENLLGLDQFASKYCQENKGSHEQVQKLVGFCLLTKKALFDEIGGFDERFGLGNYEADDLCLRMLNKGCITC